MKGGQTFEEANPVHPYRAAQPDNPGQRAVVGHLVRSTTVYTKQPSDLRNCQVVVIRIHVDLLLYIGPRGSIVTSQAR
ncbi:MAG: hypothetical protein AVDCRST_MAG93-9724 [uncultured Chloroflexia bacterium]|uniref:Uncharacterized protein n=1 Tax=uncultured Chloroflexia bacterium TaxID=1672391 RepID=A0A6J4NS61_9CHLR|nr:MAG: hypothetical protein AVDCRST_MAG93-9724 [uncultured Chloroflexia bacterium]